MLASHVWRERPCNGPNNKANDPTSGRSTHCESGHLIQVFHDIGRIFSSQHPHWRLCFLVARFGPRDLLFCAKYLLFAAMDAGATGTRREAAIIRATGFRADNTSAWVGDLARHDQPRRDRGTADHFSISSSPTLPDRRTYPHPVIAFIH